MIRTLGARLRGAALAYVSSAGRHRRRVDKALADTRRREALEQIAKQDLHRRGGFGGYGGP